MMEPHAFHQETGAFVPFSQAPDEALQACIEAPVAAFTIPADQVPITKAIAARILQGRVQVGGA